MRIFTGIPVVNSKDQRKSQSLNRWNVQSLTWREDHFTTLKYLNWNMSVERYTEKQKSQKNSRTQWWYFSSSLINDLKFTCRPYPYSGDVIIEQGCNQSFIRKVQAAEYNTSVTITGATKGTSREKPYRELGLESLKDLEFFKHLFTAYALSG